MSATYFEKLTDMVMQAHKDTTDDARREKLADAGTAIMHVRYAEAKVLDLIDWLTRRLEEARRDVERRLGLHSSGIIQGSGVDLDLANQALLFALRDLENAWGRAGLDDLPKE